MDVHHQPGRDPTNPSPGTGVANVALDDVAHTLLVDVVFSGLSAPTGVAHIHCCVAPPGNVGVATQTPTFTGFPSGVTSGTYSHLFDTADLATFRAGFVADHGGTASGAELALLAGLMAGQAYFNIHTSAFPGGEIRGFLRPAAVPLPATTLLISLGLLPLAAVAHRKRGG